MFYLYMPWTRRETPASPCHIANSIFYTSSWTHFIGSVAQSKFENDISEGWKIICVLKKVFLYKKKSGYIIIELKFNLHAVDNYKEIDQSGTFQRRTVCAAPF